MYEHLHRFRTPGLRENEIPDPSGQPATIIGKTVEPTEDVAADLSQKLATEKARKEGLEPGTAEYMEFIREYMKKEGRRREDFTPSTPAANPDDPQQTTTNKEMEGRGRRQEAFDPTQFDKDEARRREEARRRAEARRREGQEPEVPEGDEPIQPPEMEGDDPDDPKPESRRKTEAMISAVLKGHSPRTVVEAVAFGKK